MNRIFPAQEVIFEDCDQQPVLRVVLTFLWHGIQFLGPGWTSWDIVGPLKLSGRWLFDSVNQNHSRLGFAASSPVEPPLSYQVSSHFGSLEL